MDIVKESRIEAKNIVIMVIWLRICCSYLFTFTEFNKKNSYFTEERNEDLTVFMGLGESKA